MSNDAAVTFDGVPLTPVDRLEISELPGRYADALDLLQPEELRSVFTEDAVWEVVDGRRLVGIDEIMEFMGRPDVHPGAHLMTNIYVGSVDDADGYPVVQLRSRGVFPVGFLGSDGPTGKTPRERRWTPGYPSASSTEPT